MKLSDESTTPLLAGAHGNAATWQSEQMDSQLPNLASTEARTKINLDTNDFSHVCISAWESTQTVQVYPGTCSDINNI